MTVMQVWRPRALCGLVRRLLVTLLVTLPAACAPSASEPPTPAPSDAPAPRAQALSDAPPTPATPATPASQPLTPRISREQLLAQLRERLSRPAGGLREQRGPDGTRRIALDGHLQHATLAVIGADGRVHTSCVDSPAAAAHVLGVSEAAGTP